MFDEEDKKNKPFGLGVHDTKVHGVLDYLIEVEHLIVLFPQTLIVSVEFLGCEEENVISEIDDILHCVTPFF